VTGATIDVQRPPGGWSNLCGSLLHVLVAIAPRDLRFAPSSAAVRVSPSWVAPEAMIVEDPPQAAVVDLPPAVMAELEPARTRSVRTQPVPPTGRPDVPPSLAQSTANLAERGDVHSLGATLWQLLVGRSPFGVPGGDNSAYALMATEPDDRTSVTRAAEPAAARRRPLVLAGAAVGVCLAVIAVLLLRPSAEPEAGPSPTTTRTGVATESQTTDSAIGDGVFAAPVVVANPKVGAVEFTWSYSGPNSTDTYRVHIGSTPEDAQIADPVTLPKATYSVKTASGAPMCLIATVIRAGHISPASSAVCGTAR
jgi:hypothetical protein